MFNLNKTAKKEKQKLTPVEDLFVKSQDKVVKPTQKMLEDDRKDKGSVTQQQFPHTFQNQLKDVRTDKDQLVGYQKLLDKSRLDQKDQNSIQYRLQNSGKHTDDSDKIPPMDNAFVGKKATSKQAKDDKFKSQLLSNYDSREDFNKAVGIKSSDKKEKLVSADAMIYYIYRTAASENRQVNQQQTQILNDINSAKIRILNAE